MIGLDDMFNERKVGALNAWDRASMVKSIIYVSRLALENDSPDMPEDVRRDRVSNVLRIAEHLADLIEEDAAQCNAR